MAPDLVGMLAAGALKVAAGKAAEAVGDRIMLQWKLGEDLEDMQDTMESIEAVLEEAERRAPEDKPTQLWLQRLTHASYNISDMFDEFEVNKTRKSTLRKLKILNPCLTLPSEVRMASKLKKVRETLDKISDQRLKYINPTTSSCSRDQQDMTQPEMIEAAEIVGRNQEKLNILALLSSSSSDFIVLPIYGIGGIGKTTLAHLLFTDTYFKDYEKAWVYVSQTFDLKRIKDAVTSQLRLNQGELANKQEQEDGGSARKSILIVLDDLWEKEDFKLGDMKNFLKNVGNRYKVHVIVTTRDASIAEKVQTIEAHRIQTLSDDVCWDIIKKNSGFEQRDTNNKEMFEGIGKEIANKCGGVALAARAIGYILRSKDFHGWVSVKESGIWKESTQVSSSPYDRVLASLKLSYNSMQPQVRLCFVYCAVFPKGHKVTKDELIYQWAALGFIKPSSEFPKWKHGEDYIKQLLEMSFLSKSQHWNDLWGREDITLFTMHDLVHDLARSIMADEVLGADENSKSGGSKCRYVSRADCSKPLNPLVTHPNKIKVLQFLGSGETGHCHAEFSNAKYLRILDLGKCSLEKLPSFIGYLRLLRYLNISGITGQEIPRCLTKLSKLLYLKLSGSCNLLGLPESIGEMEGLMYLDLSGCMKLKMLPASFGKLQNLVHLDLCRCSELKVTPGDLCSLTKLQFLNLSRCFKLTKEPLEVIGELTELRYLNLTSCLNNNQHCEGGIGNLIDRMSALSNLEHLDLSWNECLEILPDSICSFKKLNTLNLACCFRLRKLPENMGNIKFLNTDGCFELDNSTLVANKNVIPLPNFMVHAAEGERSSNLTLLKDVSPRKLAIKCLENAKSAEEGRRIRLRGKQSLECLTLHWTKGMKGFVENIDLLSELVPPSSLESFDLHGYNSVSFPSWLEGIGIYLPNLVKVSLRNLSWCTNLPPLGQLPNLEELTLGAMPNITKIDQSLIGDYTMKAFTQLKHLYIENMENLKEWTTTNSGGEGSVDEFMFPNLEQLKIKRCPKLRVSPCPPRVRETWIINRSDGVLSKWGECAPHHTICPTLTAVVGALEVRYCKEPMHQWKLLHHLHGLHKLRISSCNDLSLSNSPEISGVLANLQSLYFGYIEGIEVLPQWISDCVSLKKLKIWGCERASFPENIRLNHLDSLKIYRCPALREWIELEENKTKIAHIRQRQINFSGQRNVARLIIRRME